MQQQQILQRSVTDNPEKKQLQYVTCLEKIQVSTTAANFKNSANQSQLECGPMTNVMATVPNVGGALCSMPQIVADAHYSSVVQ